MYTVYKNADVLDDKKQYKERLNRTVNIKEFAKPLKLESGKTLTDVRIAYETYGRINSQKSNVILVCHSLTGNAHLAGEAHHPQKINETIPENRENIKAEKGWWDAVIGPGKLLDSDKYFIIGADNLASITKWYNFNWLNSNIKWVIATRAGYNLETDALRDFKIIKVEIDISSTQIRDKETEE